MTTKLDKKTNTISNHTTTSRDCCSFGWWTKNILIVALLLKLLNPALNYAILGPGSSSWPFTLLADATPNPSSTTPASFPVDVVDYRGFQFAPSSADYITHEHFGYTIAFMKWMPRWALHLMNCAIVLFGDETNVTIHDARGKDFSFHDTGFTLHKMSRPSATTNWRSQTDIKTFQAEMEPVLRDLVPGAKRIEWTYQVLRGLQDMSDEPVLVNSVHLDYAQNDTVRDDFYAEYGFDGIVKETGIDLSGGEDNGTEKLAAILGVWKPIYMNSPVCDHPLAIMDARTFSPDDERALGLHLGIIDFLVFENLRFVWERIHFMISQIVHRASQRWYYYPMQRTDEVLLFTHYTRGHHFATPHASFTNPHCTRGMETRKSVEMRVAVYV